MNASIKILCISLIALSALCTFADEPVGSESDPWLVGSPNAADVVAYTNDVNTLIVSGTGSMTNYTWQGDVPWINARSSIVRAEISPNITNIGGYAFYKCPKLASVSIPASVICIGDYAFAHCSALKELDIPEGVTEFGESAFYSCSLLSRLNIPKGITVIKEFVFCWCTGLETLTVLPEIPPSVNEDSSFSNCNISRAVYVPEGSVQAYQDAPGWSRFAAVIQPPPPAGHRDNPWLVGSPNAADIIAYTNNVNTLIIEGKGAMMNFESETDTPWHDCNMKIAEITIGPDLTHLGNFAFAGCSEIRQIIFLPTIPPQGGANAFSAVPLTSTLIVPCGTTAAYTNANLDSHWGFQGKFSEYYSIFINPSEHGRISASPSTLIFKDDPIEIKAFPDSQYHLVSLTYFDGEDHDITESLRFSMPATNVTLTAIFETAPQGSRQNPWNISNSSISDNVIAYTNTINELIIDGTGRTKDFATTYFNTVPWQEFREAITSVVIGPGVTELGASIFNNSVYLSRVVIRSSTVINIRPNAFEARAHNAVIYVPYGLKSSYETKCSEEKWLFSGSFAEYYNVTILPSENGRVTVDKEIILSPGGEIVTVTPLPDENCRLISLTYSDGEDHDITEALSFTMPAMNVTVKAIFAKLGTSGYPWQVGENTTAYSDDSITLTIEGVGSVTSAPWTKIARNITQLQVANGITSLGPTLTTLPNLKAVNGLSLTVFSSAAVGAARAAGISAFAVNPETCKATLEFTVKTAPSIQTEEKDWQTAAEVPVTIKAEAPAGFFIIAP